MITVVGLGNGGPESLSGAILSALRSSDALRTIGDPDDPVYCMVIDTQREAGHDLVLQPEDGPGDIAERTVRTLLSLSEERDVIYIVPGDPMLDDPVTLLLAARSRSGNLPLTVLFPGSISIRESTPDMRFLIAVMARLRDPARGCPWDLEQTLPSLKRYVLEEAYEVLEAIDKEQPSAHCEELGDLLLQVIFQAQLTREAGQFDINDITRTIGDKLIRRHPHVFGEVTVSGSEQVLTNWAAIKRTETGYEDRTSILDGIPTSLPALMRALEVSKRVVKVGFEWPEVNSVLDKVEEELRELRYEIEAGNKQRASEEIGDLLFTLVNVARKTGIDPEDALRQMTLRFAARFRRIEEFARERGQPLAGLTLDEMEEQWQNAKSQEL